MPFVIELEPSVTMPMLGGLVSQLLRKANIPSVLWGEGYQSLLGLGPGNEGVDFIVNDEDMNEAIRVLRRVGFTELQPDDEHRFVRLDPAGWDKHRKAGNLAIAGYANYYLRTQPFSIYRSDVESDDEVLELFQMCREAGYGPGYYAHIGLFLRSQVLWALPGPLNMNLPVEEDGGDFMLASDVLFPGSPPFHKWRYSASYGPVVAMSPLLFAKTYLRIMIRAVYLGDEIDLNDRTWNQLMRLSKCVAPTFEQTIQHMDNEVRFWETHGIRINQLDRIWLTWMYMHNFSKYLNGKCERSSEPTEDEQEAWVDLTLQFRMASMKLAEEPGWPEVPRSWRFQPSQ